MRIDNKTYIKLYERVCQKYSYGKLSFEKLIKRIKTLNKYAVMVMLMFVCGYASAYETEASYYTRASCIREGTSGVYTANGESYDENGFTCAMRSRDFGKMYLVTNIDNGKSVVVRHNDYGPNKKLYNKGRKIDLSKGAFKQISSLNKGVCNVEIEEIK